MKKSLLIIGILSTFIFVGKVSALTGNVNISCSPAKIKAGEVSTCTVKGSADSDIDSVDAIINLSNNLILEEVTIDSIWQGNDSSDNHISIYIDNTVKNTFNIAKIKVKAKDNIVNSDETLSLKSIHFGLEENSQSNTYDIANATANIRIPNNDAKLKTLSVGGVTLSPEFSADKTSYSAIVEESEINLTATANDSKATVSGAGQKTLSYGNNKIDVVVTAEDGSKKTYTINVNRKDTRSKDNYLNKFEFSGYDIGFDKNKTEYNLVVENSVEALGLCRNIKKDNILCANFFEKAPTTEDLKILFNDKDVLIKIESLDEVLSDLFDELDKKCSDSEKYCEVEKDGYKISLDVNKEKEAFTYRIYKDNLEIMEFEDSENAKGYYRLEDLKVGNNILKIVVTAENGDERTYTFNINRKNKDGKIVEEISKSPGTGNEVFIIVAIILVLSLGTSIYFVKKKNKKDK